jgi:hypothetical protein
LLLGPIRTGKSTLLAPANAVCGTSPLDNYAEDFSFAGPSLFSRELEGKRSRYRWVHRCIVCADEITARGVARRGALQDDVSTWGRGDARDA